MSPPNAAILREASRVRVAQAEARLNRDNDSDVPPLVARQNNRPRYSNEPVDQFLMLNSPIFRGRFREVGLPTLTLEDVLARTSISRTYIDAQILRIITPRRNQFANIMYRLKKAQGNRAEDVSYSRIYLMRVFSDINSRQNSKLFYVLQSRTSNVEIWNRNPELRDNGTIAVGSFVRIPNPGPVERFMQGIPMVNTEMRAIALRPPPVYNAIPINTNLDGNAAQAFCYNNVHLNVNRLSIVGTNCTGLHCDKQDVVSESRTTCGCFGCSPFRSNIALIFGISFRTEEGDYRVMPEFSSLAFQKLFFTSNIPPEVAPSSLQGTDIGLDIEDSIISQVDFVNDHDAFTIVGWCKRGIINDQALVSSGDPKTPGNGNGEGRVVADDVTTHVVQILPTNRNILEPGSSLSNAYRTLRYNVQLLNNED